MTSPTNETARKCGNYHHGDLRNALVIAAAELIEENGSPDIAMVDAARRAGVSSAAPYRHFADREQLLDAVTELGYVGLTQEVSQVAAACEPGSLHKIEEIGRCYLGFVIGKPAFFELMWGDRGARVMDAANASDTSNGFWIMVDAIGEWCTAEGLVDVDPLDLGLKVWAMALGLATLTLTHQIDRFVDTLDPFELLTTSGNSFLQGVKAEH